MTATTDLAWGGVGEALPQASTRPWWIRPELPAADRWIVATGAGLLRRGFSPAVVLAWLEEQ